MRAVLIAGPTASGKTALAISLAEAFGGEVINADSMQVYRDLFILSARPSEAEQEGVPHHLFGHTDGAVNHSVGRWLAELAPVLEDLAAREKVPVIVGGTGLYFKALTQGLSAIPPVPEAVRAQVRGEAEGLDSAALHARLASRDPVMAARLRPSDPQRILRALEVLAATGRSLSLWQEEREPPLLPAAHALALFLSPDREALKERIDRRFEVMMDQGAEAEVARLAARGLDPMLPVMRAHGVPGLIACQEGRISRDEAVARGQSDTRAYAKRQMTWFRTQLDGFAAVSPESAEAYARQAFRSGP